MTVATLLDILKNLDPGKEIVFPDGQSLGSLSVHDNYPIVLNPKEW